MSKFEGLGMRLSFFFLCRLALKCFTTLTGVTCLDLSLLPTQTNTSGSGIPDRPVRQVMYVCMCVYVCMYVCMCVMYIIAGTEQIIWPYQFVEVYIVHSCTHTHTHTHTQKPPWCSQLWPPTRGGWWRCVGPQTMNTSSSPAPTTAPSVCGTRVAPRYHCSPSQHMKGRCYVSTGHYQR